MLLFYQSCSTMLTVLLQGCWANNPVVTCDIFTRVGLFQSMKKSLSSKRKLLHAYTVIIRTSFIVTEWEKPREVSRQMPAEWSAYDAA